MADGGLRREGKAWVLRSADVEARLRNTKGLRYLVALLTDPGRDIHVLDLAAGDPAARAADTGDEELLDRRARQEYRSRLTELEADLADAEAMGDGERAARARAERDQIAAALASAMGIGGVARRGAGPAERARQTVRHGIRSAIARIGEHFPDLGAALERDVRTGMFCAYQPGDGPVLTVAMSDRRRRTDARSGSLPTRATSFIGREIETADIRRLLARTRLVTLTGPGGSGKTRLAVETAAAVAGRFPDGAWFVDLSGARSGDEVLPLAARALSLDDALGHGIERVASRFADARALVLLDNCEQVREAAAGLAGALIGASAEMRVIATSREPLGSETEVVHAVGPLPVPPEGASPKELLRTAAARLFAERARRIDPSFEITAGNAHDVASICRHLDGMPLAIELAAGKLTVLEPAEIASRLGDRLSLLRESRTERPERHQTLRAAMAWSLDLLTPPERTLFRRLGVFEESFDADAVEAVCAGGEVPPSDVLLMLERLILTSLVSRQRDGGVARDRLLETVRALAREELGSAGETASLREAHLDWYLALAGRAEPHLQGGRERERWLRRLELEHADLLAAVSFAREVDADRHIKLVALLAPYWRLRGHWRIGVASIANALSHGHGSAESRLHATIEYGLILHYLGEPGAHEHLRTALTMAREQGDDRALGATLVGLSLATEGTAEDERWATEAVEQGRATSDEELLSAALNRLAVIRSRRGDLTAARMLHEEALEIAARIGDDRTLATATYGIGQALFYLGDVEGGRARLQEAVEAFHRAQDRRELATTLAQLGAVMMREGDLAAARRTLEEAIDRARMLGDRERTGQAQTILADLHLMEGRRDEAGALWRIALRNAEAIGDDLTRARALHGAGRVALLGGDIDAALSLLRSGLRAQAALGNKRGIASGLEFLAKAAVEAGDPTAAAEMLGVADALRESVGPTMFADDRAATERAATEALGGAGFEEARARGRALPIDEAAARFAP